MQTILVFVSKSPCVLGFVCCGLMKEAHGDAPYIRRGSMALHGVKPYYIM